MATTSMAGIRVNALLSSSYPQHHHVGDAFPRPLSFHSSSPPPPCLSQTQLLQNLVRVSQKRDEFWRRPVATDSSAEAAAEALEGSEPEAGKAGEEAEAAEIEKLGVVVKATEKARLVLKFIWMEKNIGLALDQAIPGHGTIPLSPYYFWPRKDAWEELKTLLESKPWISQKRMIILLNQATDIINLWQQSGGGL